MGLQTITMAELRDHHNKAAVKRQGHLRQDSTVGSYVETDPRMSLYNYTMDGINLLVLPMIREK